MATPAPSPAAPAQAVVVADHSAAKFMAMVGGGGALLGYLVGGRTGALVGGVLGAAALPALTWSAMRKGGGMT